MSQLLEELDVLIAATLWLAERGLRPTHVSIASGGSKPKWEAQRLLHEALAARNVPLGFSATQFGADVIAESPSEIWRVECKGAGTGAPQTQRNNFDRAMASVASYYEAPVGDQAATLGLALPETAAYLHELRRRVRRPLRARLDLWILLVDPVTRRVRAIAPADEYAA